MTIKFQNYRKYFDPAVLNKLTSLELKARLVVEGFMVGLHKSPYHGFSVEFSEHRFYNQGDPLKNIDWKVYAKSEKFFVKRYEEETNLICHVILDVSKSMNYKYEGEVTKLEYGSVLAASLIYVMLQQKDSIGLALYSDRIETFLTPKSTKIYLKTLLKSLDSINPSNKTQTSGCLHTIAEKIKKRGLVIVISDFFDEPGSVVTALKHFHFQKNEVVVFHVLDPVEKNFSFGNDAVFVDKETGEEMTTQPYQIQKSYQKAMDNFIDKIKTDCINSKIDYNLVETTTPYDKALLSYFKKRSRLN